MPLTAVAVAKAQPGEKDIKLSDEKGMFLLVKKTGAKYWRMKYRFAGKEKLLALGVYPEVSLKEAREKRDAGRRMLADGIDPSLHKQANQQATAIAASNTFQAVADEWLKVKVVERSELTQQRVRRVLELDLLPYLGKKPISEITSPDVLATLRLIEKRGALETTKKAKNITSQIFRFAIATGLADRDPSADLKGALRVKSVKHRSAITDPAGVGVLMAAIDDFDGTMVVKAALQMSALCFCRPGEIRHLEWSEVNWAEERIELPGEKMKMGDPHIIPLSTQARAVLRDLQPLTDRSRYVFPSARGASRPLSENGVRTALRTMGFDNDTMTPHGFRAMARTLLDEVLGFRIEWIEQQLAHAVKDVHGRAYNRTKHLPQRREMMQRWADYLDELKIQAKKKAG